MTQPSANEQYLLELINAERAKAGAQPLAFDSSLLASAESHSSWMLSTDAFSHIGLGGSTATERMTAAGYQFAGSWTSGENIAWATMRAPSGDQDEALLLHTNLMNSDGHRANILNDSYKEIGVGFEIGDYQGRESAFVTENFARSGSGSQLTGVAYRDGDGDKFYDPGEGLGSIAVTAVSTTGQIYSTTTMSAGGYQLDLPVGSYTVTFSADGITATSHSVSIGSRNVKLDLINPAAGTVSPAPTPAPTTSSARISGTSGHDQLVGTSKANVIKGGAGNDQLWGKAGKDTLYGSTGHDTFVFDTKPSKSNLDMIKDFNVRYDRIWLDNAVFKKLGKKGSVDQPAKIKTAYFEVGERADDRNDYLIYD